MSAAGLRGRPASDLCAVAVTNGHFNILPTDREIQAVDAYDGTSSYSIACIARTILSFEAVLQWTTRQYDGGATCESIESTTKGNHRIVDYLTLKRDGLL